MMAPHCMTGRIVENDAHHSGAVKSPATGMKYPSRGFVKAFLRAGSCPAATDALASAVIRLSADRELSGCGC